jgi:NADH dehydrogenase [ubiquinone] 1 alpha subcomplex assembly factor 7
MRHFPAYQANARLETPLAAKFKAQIRRDGPISVRQYMQACLHDPEHGYYRAKTAIGSKGDFVTAPEISQIFGELIGLWCAVVWEQMGKPAIFNLVELGPGRGTLMRDAVRALKVVPAMATAASVHLIESNFVLMEQQREALDSLTRPPMWHASIDALKDSRAILPLPTIIIANEFIDTLAVDQWERKDGTWRVREVGLNAQGELAFVATAADPELSMIALPESLAAMAEEGSIFEASAARAEFFSSAIGRRNTMAPMAALFLDYGHRASSFGDTVQAVREQRHVSIFYAPGDSDISANVDFEHAMACCAHFGAVDGPMSQSDFLSGLGITERATRLMKANPDKANMIETSVARLMAPGGMGTRFKVFATRTRSLPPLPVLSHAGIAARTAAARGL